ncbi:CsbD family protein [Bradyrhizobium sp. S69]|uniref:CsbD family protein n=1 Tax=Bradyrhizobium sp. S69 TaxID=1641856 RepID=UPI00131AB970|nr:CsbD family protein [Bradyrhizobium sp. S69]
MGATTDKIKGVANEAIGKAKQGIGEATGSDRLQGEGVIQEVKGKGQEAVGDAKQATKDAVNNAAGAANKNL